MNNDILSSSFSWTTSTQQWLYRTYDSCNDGAVLKFTLRWEWGAYGSRQKGRAGIGGKKREGEERFMVSQLGGKHQLGQQF